MSMDVRSELRPGSDGSLKEVRVFSDTALQSAIDGALQSVKPGSRGAILEVNMPESGGVVAVAAARLDEHWSVALSGSYTGNRKVIGGARVAFEW